MLGTRKSIREIRLYRKFLPIRPRETCLLSYTQKTLKTAEQLPGTKNLFGLRIRKFIYQALRATLVTPDKPIGAIALELQVRRVNALGTIHRIDVPGLKLCVGLGDPIEMARVLRNEPKYPRRITVPGLDYYRELRKAVPGVFFANGEDWYRYRSTVSKRILKPREIAEYAPVFNEISNDFITRIDSNRLPAGTNNEYEVKNLENELFKWSFESVAHVLFDRRFGCLENEVNPKAQGFIDSVGGFLSTLFQIDLLPVWFYKIYETKVFKDFLFHVDSMYRYTDLFINEKLRELKNKRNTEQGIEDESEEKAPGFMEYLLFNRKLSRDDLMGCMFDLLFAGVDTTTNSMQWFLYMMSKNPDKQEKVFQEISIALQGGELPTAETISRMPYLKACLKETLRLYPVVGQSGRIIPTDMEILGYHIPKGTQIIFLYYYMGRSEKYFNDAHDFIPERWLKDGKREVMDTTQAFASIPFGFGRRMCVGRRIAELELYILATKLIQKYKFQYPENEVVEPFMKSTTTPDRPLRVKFIHRA